MVDRAVKRLPPKARKQLDWDSLTEVAASFNLTDEDSLWAAVGFGEIEPDTVIQRLMPEKKGPETLAEEIESFRDLEEQNVAPAVRASVSMGDLEGLAARRSKCCNPIPGDQIRGYITRGSGLAIHKADCKNLIHRQELEPERVRDIDWGRTKTPETYRASIEVVALDRVGLLSHLTAVISEMGTNIASAHVNTERPSVATIRLAVDVVDRSELNELVGRLEDLIDVISARAVPHKGPSHAGPR